MTPPRALAIGLFFNDDDIVDDWISHMLANQHDIVVWDHGSTDDTALKLDEWEHKGVFRERHFLPRSFDFYKIFEHVSRHVIAHLARDYDWISFPESDEILEGPTRDGNYYEWLCRIHDSPCDWLRFTNMVFWWTDQDGPTILSPRQRIKHYSVWHDCPPRVYAWRASAMNVREFNHNPAGGTRHPADFTTCHYQWRSEAQALKRIEGRRGLRRGPSNVHFDTMTELAKLRIPASRLHRDDGGELSMAQTVDFRSLYGV